MARAFHGISLAASWPWNSGKREMVHHMQKGTYSTAAARSVARWREQTALEVLRVHTS